MLKNTVQVFALHVSLVCMSLISLYHTTCTFKTWNSLCFCCLMMFNGKVCSIGLLDTEAVFICLHVFFNTV